MRVRWDMGVIGKFRVCGCMCDNYLSRGGCVCMYVYVIGVCVIIFGFVECGDVCNGCIYVRV